MFAMNTCLSDPLAKYILLTDIVPVDDCRYKFHNRSAPVSPTLSLRCYMRNILVKMLHAYSPLILPPHVSIGAYLV